MALNQAQIDQLLQPLHRSRVMQKKGQAYLAAWDVRRWLIRIFGPAGWNFEVREIELAREIEIPPEEPDGKTRWTVVYRAVGRLTIKDPDGDVVGMWEDVATGDGVRQPSLGDAHDLAAKTSVSQALKRCAVNLGDQFGLGLYNSGRLDPVVVRYLSTPVDAPAEPSEDAPVETDAYDPTLDRPLEAEPDDRPAERAQQAPPSQWEQKPQPDPFDALLARVGTSWQDGRALAALLKEARTAKVLNRPVPQKDGSRVTFGQMVTTRVEQLAAEAQPALDDTRTTDAPAAEAWQQLLEAARKAGFKTDAEVVAEFERNYKTPFDAATPELFTDMRKVLEGTS